MKPTGKGKLAALVLLAAWAAPTPAQNDCQVDLHSGVPLRSTVDSSSLNVGGPAPCLAPVRGQDIFWFEDSQSLLLTDYSPAEIFALRVEAANALVAAHGDVFDFVGFWLNFQPHHQTGVAVHTGLRNDVEGLGLSVREPAASVGLQSTRLQSFVTLWNINITFVPGDSTVEGVATQFTLAHEFEHRFAMFLSPLADGRRLASGDGCGPQNSSHWNTKVDLQGGALASYEWIGNSPAVLGGNCAHPNGPFLCTNSDTGGMYGFTDLYLMGYVSPSEMDAGNSELRYMDESCDNPYFGPISHFDSNDIIAANGPRIPSSLNSQKHFRTGWVMIHLPGAPPTPDEIERARSIVQLYATQSAGNLLDRGTHSQSLSFDCNCNGVADDEDLLMGQSLDCNANGIPDECDADCNDNSIPDECEILMGTLADCDGDGVPDVCDLDAGGAIVLSEDFESGLPPDWALAGDFAVTGQCALESSCGEGSWAYAGDVATCRQPDGQGAEMTLPALELPPSAIELRYCSRLDVDPLFAAGVRVNGTVVHRETGEAGIWEKRRLDLSAFAGQEVRISFELTGDALLSGHLGWQIDDVIVMAGQQDCNGNGIPDGCDIESGFSGDCTSNLVPDECESSPDCNGNGVADFNEVCGGQAPDCNENGIPDGCETVAGTVPDCNANQIPDGCEVDCNGNSVPDDCDIAAGTSPDCNGDGFPDDCGFGTTTTEVTYRLGAADLVNVPSTCPVGPFNMCDTDLHPGFAWADTVAGTPLVVEIRFALGINCPQGSRSHTATLNGVATDVVIDPAPMCPCGVGETRDVFVGALPSSYAVGDSNTFLITDPLGCMGFAPRADLAGDFAEVRVFYNPPSVDCNTNGTPDSCDIESGSSLDEDGNGVPDECEGPTRTPAASTGIRLEVFPNPAGASVNVMLRGSVGPPAALTVYDMSGRVIRRLSTSTAGEGVRSATWHGKDQRGRDVANGLYLLRYQQGGRTAAAKFLLMR